MKREEALERIEQGLDDLDRALRAGQSDALRQYLAFMARFHRYSFNNSLLIFLQFPSATCVAGYRKWQSLGRQVKKGEKGIAIFAPVTYRRKRDEDDDEQRDDARKSSSVLRGFRVTHVFDISQTEGDDLPELAPVVGDVGDLVPRLEQVIRQAGIELRDEDLAGGVKGYSVIDRIGIRRDLPLNERAAVLLHELCHEWAHSIERRQEAAKSVKETEAEAVACVVCSVFGLDSLTRSSDYIQLHRGDTEMLADSLEVIQKTAMRIVEAIETVELPETEPVHD